MLLGSGCWLDQSKQIFLNTLKKYCDNNVVNVRDFYHDDGQASQMRFKQHVELLARGWEDIGDPFEEECPYLLNIYDQTVVPEEVSTCIYDL